MKVAGIIAEYNPFHDGHAYQIRKTKELTGADYVVIVMSGNFVQRGLPAVMEKHLRTEAALLHGADAVFELPVPAATGGASYFARGAVALLSALGVVDYLSFGCETDDLTLLTRTAEFLLDEPAAYQADFQQFMKAGFSYPLARKEALFKHLGAECASLVDTPNNTLAIEYLKEIKRLNSQMIPIAVKRLGNYHDATLNVNNIENDDSKNRYISATAFRNALETGDSYAVLRNSISSDLYDFYQPHYNKSFPIFPNDFSLVLGHTLLSLPAENNCFDCSEDLYRRIYRMRKEFTSYEEFCQMVHTKQFPLATVQRSILHCILGLKNDAAVFPAYLPLLGFRKDSGALLSEIKESGTLPLLAKPADGKKIFATDSAEYAQWNTTLRSDYLYRLVQSQRFANIFPTPEKAGIVLLPNEK
ncbi:MAG: nucleotidyltransferase family protein [Lachnospiraceae bacterium]|nr:nucleotidyltransferase family protein [Lachnospiraceae bacterium]